ncbi:MAG: hypothetical protein H6862_04250 [Rhodospirillales bacterium]|nr:hypothetical protein [Rhodospirillales bacterium]
MVSGIFSAFRGARWGLWALLLLLCAPNSAMAMTLGDSITNVTVSVQDVPGLLAGFSYLMGIVLGAWGIAKTYNHVLNPTQVPIWEAIQRFLAGGALFALPMVLEATYNTVAAGLVGAGLTGFNASGTIGYGLDAMLYQFMRDIFSPTVWMLTGFCYLAGVILVIVGIMRMLKRADEGVRGPGGIGTIFIFLVAGALLSGNAMLGAFSTSLFGTPDVATFGVLQYTTGMTGAEVAHVHTVISSVLAFMTIVGAISFIRGFFILKDYSNGDQQASLMASFTHLFGGALLFNLGPLLNAVQYTLGIDTFGLIFS